MAEGDNDQGAAAPRAEAGIIATEVACRLLMLSRQRVDQLAKDGWIARHAPGHWRLIDLVQGYIRFLRDEGRRTSVHAADSRVRDARAREIEIRTAERLGELVAIEEHDSVVDAICGVYRPTFFLSVRVLSRLVRRILLEKLAAAHSAGHLSFFADRAALAETGAFTASLAGTMKALRLPARANLVTYGFGCRPHARLASGWRAAPLPGGARTLWIASKGFRLHSILLSRTSPVGRGLCQEAIRRAAGRARLSGAVHLCPASAPVR